MLINDLGDIDSIEIVNLKIPWGLWFYWCIFRSRVRVSRIITINLSTPTFSLNSKGDHRKKIIVMIYIYNMYIYMYNIIHTIWYGFLPKLPRCCGTPWCPGTSRPSFAPRWCPGRHARVCVLLARALSRGDLGFSHDFPEKKWLVVWNMTGFFFPFSIWDVIRNPLTNSIIFQDG